MANFFKQTVLKSNYHFEKSTKYLQLRRKLVGHQFDNQRAKTLKFEKISKYESNASKNFVATILETKFVLLKNISYSSHKKLAGA